MCKPFQYILNVDKNEGDRFSEWNPSVCSARNYVSYRVQMLVPMPGKGFSYCEVLLHFISSIYYTTFAMYFVLNYSHKIETIFVC
jgi:hypothetical protein